MWCCGMLKENRSLPMPAGVFALGKIVPWREGPSPTNEVDACVGQRYLRQASKLGAGDITNSLAGKAQIPQEFVVASRLFKWNQKFHLKA